MGESKKQVGSVAQWLQEQRRERKVVGLRLTEKISENCQGNGANGGKAFTKGLASVIRKTD